MATNGTAKAPWEEGDYLGCISVQRPGEGAPAITAHVIRSGGHLLYRKSVATMGGTSWFEPARFATDDRRRSLAVMEDDTPERQQALAESLRGDRWRRVTVRG